MQICGENKLLGGKNTRFFTVYNVTHVSERLQQYSLLVAVRDCDAKEGMRRPENKY